MIQVGGAAPEEQHSEQGEAQAQDEVGAQPRHASPESSGTHVMSISDKVISGCPRWLRCRAARTGIIAPPAAPAHPLSAHSRLGYTLGGACGRVARAQDTVVLPVAPQAACGAWGRATGG